MLIRNATIYTAVQREPVQGDILIRNGKIAAVGPNLDATGEEVFDATGLNAYPGFVEAHCHIGLDGYGIGYEGADYNEYNDSVVPQLRAIDGIEPLDPTLGMAARAGVTTVCTGPGSANVLGGTFVAIKTVGRCVDDMIVKDNVAMKCAFGENPKRCYASKCDSSRMTTAAILREALMKARLYLQKKEAAGDDVFRQPAFDMKLEALIPVLRGQIPLKAHAHRADDILTALRIAKEFDVDITLDHVTEGHLIVNHLVQAGKPVLVGPSFGSKSKQELREKSFATAGILDDAGLEVCIITDAPVIPLYYLPLCAGLAVKAGMKEESAWRAITINPAHVVGIDGRVGSIEAGKDADIAIFEGNPLRDIQCRTKAVFVNGEEVLSQIKTRV